MDVTKIRTGDIIDKVIEFNRNKSAGALLRKILEDEMNKFYENVSRKEARSYDKLALYRKFLSAFRLDSLYLKYQDDYESGFVPTVHFHSKPPSPENGGELTYDITPDHEFVREMVLIMKIQWLSDKIAELEAMEAPVSLEGKKRLTWIGKPAQLGFVIRELVANGYIEGPKDRKGDPNYAELARQVIESFDVETTVGSMSQSLNPNKESGQISDKAKEEFKIPYIGMIN